MTSGRPDVPKVIRNGAGNLVSLALGLAVLSLLIVAAPLGGPGAGPLTSHPAGAIRSLSSPAPSVREAGVPLSAHSAITPHWPEVQVAFVLETTPYDGVYDPTVRDWGQLLGGPGDACGASLPGTGPLCEESNGVPFFVANASAIAAGIQTANPSSNVSFALVDYSASHDAFDNLNGTEYHVDTPNFLPAASFGAAVNASFVANVLGNQSFYQNSDLSDNILHSASITALYETIVGTGLNWSNETHHVVVWIGSTAPRDPNYVEDYCVSPSDFDQSIGGSAGTGAACFDPTCEPAATFGNSSVPACEAWVVPQNSSTNNSIALLARSAPGCTSALGGSCTVDTIDYLNGVTDPLSYAWPRLLNSTGGGPGGSAAAADSSNILRAGCDLASATAGSWDGPSFYTCPQGSVGTLSYSPHGPYASPDTSNPTLLGALTSVGFGPVQNSTPVSVRVTSNVTSGPGPLAVSFQTFVSHGSGSYSIAWTFGDGSTGVGPGVDHTFEVPGTYDVRATATNATSEANGLVPIEVRGPARAPLTLALQVVPGAGDSPLGVLLTATPGGGFVPYELSLCFQTGANAGQCQTPPVNLTNVRGVVSQSYLYAGPGIFTVTGTLSEPAGNGSGSVEIPAVATTTVVVAAIAPLDAIAQSGSVEGTAPVAVTFQVNVSGGTAPYSVEWAFGDGDQGSSIAGRPISHVYALAGSFEPSVRVTDATGRTVSVDLAAVHVGRLGGGLSANHQFGWIGPGLDTAVAVLLIAAGFVLVIGIADLRRRARWRREGAALLQAMENAARMSEGPRSEQ